MTSPTSQRRQISAHLSAGNALTALEALRLFQCFRLAPRILELRSDGMNIITTMIDVAGKRIARYTLGSAT